MCTSGFPWDGDGELGKHRRRWHLQELEPAWTENEGPRYNTGFSFDCPVHGTHRLIVRFVNPYDGFEYVDGPGLLVRMVANGSFDELTLSTPAGGDVLEFPICGKLRVIEGRVELAR